MQTPDPDELIFIYDPTSRVKQLVRFDDLKVNIHKYISCKVYHNIHDTQPVDDFVREKLGLK
jgi:hypothetical protein